jgi:pyruvate dehydrogenase E2 component (dihydrolipoamide acetyltransferase)
MAYSVAMPALGESVTEGTVTRWLKQEGDTVDVDEPLVEVSTDKVDTEIPSPAAGVLQRIMVPEDETVKVGVELAVIGDALPQAGASQLRSVAPAPRPTTPPAAGTGTPVVMPALGESVTAGTVTRWLKQVDDPVDVDEPLVEVSTDKVDTEIPSPVAGTVLEIIVPQDETVPIGATLAMIGDRVTAVPPAPVQPEPPTEHAPASGFGESLGEYSGGPLREHSGGPLREHSGGPLREHSGGPLREHSGGPLREHSGAPLGEQSGAPYVTPLVRKLAAEHGIDLSSVQGTGVGGRIRKQDVLAAVGTPEPEPEPQPLASQPLPPSQPPIPAMPAPEQQHPSAAAPRPVQPSVRPSELRGRTEKMSRMRSVIAQRMVESLQISAQLTTVVEADITRLARLRDRAKRDFETREGVKLSFLPFFAQAAVEALKQHPKLNASIDTDKGEVTYHGAEHLGIAVDTERGLLVPVIHDAGDLNIAGLARRIADLAERTRTNKITPDEMSGGTFTISNTGSRGALFDTPIILQPQVGILGTGTVVKRPVVLSGEDGDTLAVRSVTYLALSYDHRLVDGADAARFLNTIKQHLTDAAFERDLGL